MSERARLPGPCAHLDFLIIGAMKAGSTSLFEFLAAHPSVYVPRNKEPHYFSMRYYFPSAYYRWLFRERTQDQLCGEASTSYSNIYRFPRCPERIANDAPNARVIYLIRDPIERVLSNLRHLRLRGQKIDVDSKTLTDPSLWNKSRYRATIEAYLRFIPRSRIFIADLYDLPGDDDWLRKVLRFLDLDDPSESLALPRSNVSERRKIASPWVSRMARTPLGSLVRDMLPSGKIQQIKNVASQSTRRDLPDISGINEEVLRARFPDLCGELDSQYLWVRKHFIENSQAEDTLRNAPIE